MWEKDTRNINHGIPEENPTSTPRQNKGPAELAT